MLRALDEVYIIISANSYSSPSRDGSGVDDGDSKEGSQQSERKRGRKKELLETLFSEVLEKIGDCEEEAAMTWWYTYRPVLISVSGDVDGGGGKGEEGLLGTILLGSSKLNRFITIFIVFSFSDLSLSFLSAACKSLII